MARGKSFGGKDAGRIAATVRRQERYYKIPADVRTRDHVVAPAGLVPVKLPATAIAAGSPGSPTSGTGHLYLPTAVGSPGLTADSANITLYNTSATATPTGSKMGWAVLKFGLYYLVSWDC